MSLPLQKAIQRLSPRAPFNYHGGNWKRILSWDKVFKEAFIWENTSETSQKQGTDPSICIAALKACSSIKNLETGKKIHSDILKWDERAGLTLTNMLVNMYAKCGSMVDARSVFEDMPQHDVVSFNSLIFGYAVNGESQVALELFSGMEAATGCTPNARTFLAALVACASLAERENHKLVDGKLVKVESLERAVKIHVQAAASCCQDIYVVTTLIDLYAKCGSMVEASRVFHRMPQYTVIPWTTLIQGFVENGESDTALEYFSSMRAAGIVPDARTYVAALMACTSLAEKEEGSEVEGKLVKLESLEKGMLIHSQIGSRECASDIILANSLVKLYAECGSLVDASMAFERMLHHDTVAWNTFILGYVKNGEHELALQSYSRMRAERCKADGWTYVAALMACAGLAEKEAGREIDGKLVKAFCLERAREIHFEAANSGCDMNDAFVGSTLVDMYAKCGSMVDAQMAFDRMVTRDVVCWTALILGYAENGEGERALELFAQMREAQIKPNALTFVAALVTCGDLTMLEYGKGIHGEIYRYGLETNTRVGSSLVDFYGKCGRMVDAEQVFVSMQTRSIVTWSALLAGYSRQGNTKLVFELFWMLREEGHQPSGVTILSVLTGCSHAGLVDKGKQVFATMFSQFGVKPEIDHYRCMIDLLSRANFLDDAVALARQMPFEADAVTWNTILSGCWKWKNVEMGELAHDSLVRVDRKHPTAYVLLGNIYGSAGLWDKRAQVLDMGIRAGALEAGSKRLESWTE